MLGDVLCHIQQQVKALHGVIETCGAHHEHLAAGAYTPSIVGKAVAEEIIYGESVGNDVHTRIFHEVALAATEGEPVAYSHK